MEPEGVTVAVQELLGSEYPLMCHFPVQMALTGVSPLVARVLNCENPGPVVVCGSPGQVNAVCDRLQEESSPNTVHRYGVSQYWVGDNQSHRYSSTSAVVLSTVPISQKV